MYVYKKEMVVEGEGFRLNINVSIPADETSSKIL